MADCQTRLLLIGDCLLIRGWTVCWLDGEAVNMQVHSLKFLACDDAWGLSPPYRATRPSRAGYAFACFSDRVLMIP